MQTPLVGNDIVDLRKAESAPSSRFIHRVFSEKERARISATSKPVHLIWKYWAAKEAAFKVVRKISSSVIFAHSKFEVSDSKFKVSDNKLEVNGWGHVDYEGLRLLVLWRYGPNWIHSLALTDASVSKQVHWREIKKSEFLQNRWDGDCSATESPAKQPAKPQTESQMVRSFALREINPNNNDVRRPRSPCKGSQFSISREELDGRRLPPCVMQADSIVPGIDISLSHDGDYIAFALFQDNEVSVAC